MTQPAIRPALAADRAAIVALLDAARLPTADLEQSPIEFLVADDADALVGVVGIERHGDSGLLRSLVVQPAMKGSGLGTQLVRALEARARAAGVARLVLLTQTAAPFFARLGYATIDRNDAPSAVRDSAEFRSICPASATCMGVAL